MTYLKWAFRIAFWLIVIGFLHYTLPQRDIVRVTGTEIIRKDFSGMSRLFYAQADTGDTEVASRDLRLVNTTRANGRVSVYRNEDTGFGWPPYFKLDSSNLQAEAAEVVSTKASPQWVAIRHYGWRSPFLSIYPNAISIKPVDGPDVRLIPWFNIVFLIILFACFWAVRVRWIRFREARIDPITDDIGDGFDEARTGLGRFFGRK